MDKRLRQIADGADVIFDGYAFTIDRGNVRIYNLNSNGHASVITRAGEVLETSMDDIEIQLMLSYYSRIEKYLEW